MVGIENDMRASFFGPEASTAHVTERLLAEHPEFRSESVDIRDRDAVERIFRERAGQIELVVHTAAQPSHDWAASDPQTDFGVNANGTLNLLEATRTHAPAATFVFCSTNKVYGDTPEPAAAGGAGDAAGAARGPTATSRASTPRCRSTPRPTRCSASPRPPPTCWCRSTGATSSMPTVCFRGGCLTGPQHAGAKLHGFLAYLMKCTVTGTPYTVFGYGGKQVRDNIHCADLIAAFAAFHGAPRAAAVYNIGGGRHSNCSMLEAIDACERIAGRELDWELGEEPRIGDHRWWISDLAPFEADYPEWELRYGIEEILREIHEQNAERWSAAPA